MHSDAKNVDHPSKHKLFQGFSSFHYTALEVLLVIEQCQKRLQRVFTPEEIEAGVLKELLMEANYDIVTAVSTYLSKILISKYCATAE